MDFSRVEELLDKYLNAETSAEEEVALKKALQAPDLPSHLSGYADMFVFFEQEQKRQTVPATFDKKLLSKIDSQQQQQTRRVRVWKISGIAAGLAVAASLFFTVLHTPAQDTYTDPRKAFEETKKALLMVSERFDEGTRQVQKLETFQETKEKIEKKQIN